jgi:sugar phosphate permease
MTKFSNQAFSSSDESPTWVRWRMVLLLMAFCFLGHLNRLSIVVAADNRLMKEFHFATDEMGMVYSAFLFAYTVCMTPAGWLIDRWGAKRVLLMLAVGSAIFEATTGLGGLGMTNTAMALASFLVIRTLMGLANAPLHPGTSRMVPLWIPFAHRGLANGLLMVGAGVGIASVTLIFGYLIDWVGWRVAFFLLSCAIALLGLVWSWYATDRPAQHPSVNAAERDLIEGAVSDGSASPVANAGGPGHPGSDKVFQSPPSMTWWRLLRNRSLIFLTVSYGAVGYLEYLFFYWMNHYFVQVRHLDPQDSRYYSSIPPAVMVVGMLLGGWVSDLMVRRFGYRLGRMIVPVGGMLLGALGLYAGAKADAIEWIVGWFSLALGAIGATESPFWSTAIELGGRRHGGTAGGIFNTGGNIGGIVAPYLTPWVALKFEHVSWVPTYFGDSWRMSLYLGSLIVVAGVIVWVWINPAERISSD